MYSNFLQSWIHHQSVITEDVPPGALGMGRAKQTNVLGWVLKKRKGTKSAEAAAKKEGST